AVGIIGILTGLYTGQGFIGNLGAAVRAQLHEDFDDVVEKSFVKKILGNIVTLIGLIVGLLLTVALTVVGTGLRSVIADWLGLSGFAQSLLFIVPRSEEHTSELQSRFDLVCRLLLDCPLSLLTLPSFPTRRSSDLDDVVEKSFVKKILGNIVTLIGLIVGLLLTVALTVVGTGLRSVIADWLGLSGFAQSLLFIVP